MLHDMTDIDSSVSKAYFTRAKSGALMKSATIAIRNPKRRVISLLCINMNLDMPFSEIVKTFVPEKTMKLLPTLILPLVLMILLLRHWNLP